MINFAETSNNKTGVVVEYLVAYCKQISLNFRFVDCYIFFCLRLEGKPLVFFWFDSFYMHVYCQRIEASSFCLFNLLGLVKCLAEFILRLLVETSKATLENTEVCKAVGKNSIRITL